MNPFLSCVLEKHIPICLDLIFVQCLEAYYIEALIQLASAIVVLTSCLIQTF
jgi:hypothetical protein